MGSDAGRDERLGSGLQLLLGALVAYRLVYHSAYLRDVPFALATFSDGRQYELAALDILAHPPWGSEPFYLQGLYAYLMALPMTLAPWPSLALLAQLVLCSVALWGFFALAVHVLGRRRAGWATALLLAYPMLAFYENKFLTAALAVMVSVALLGASVALQRRPSLGRVVAVGVFTGLAVLARPNFVLLIPFVLVAVGLLARRNRVWVPRWVVAAALGCALSLGPMLVRNLIVTGQPTVAPAHAGGTSFYIGNNAEANGVWNDAGGLLSGDVARETTELAEQLEIEADTEAQRVAAIGRALYRRGFSEIAEDPVRWLRLEAKKAWLLAGNDELVQDYDLHGEQELIWFAHRLGVPFGALLVFGSIGAVVWIRRARWDPKLAPIVWVLAGLIVATLAANLGYFTSSQHRLPLVVPLALLSVPGFEAVLRAREARHWGAVALVVLALACTLVPRSSKTEPSAVHDYNLAVAWLQLDQPRQAREALDQAVKRRPDHPVILLERASVARRQGDFEVARADLEVLAELEDVPQWVHERAARERRIIDALTGQR